MLSMMLQALLLGHAFAQAKPLPLELPSWAQPRFKEQGLDAKYEFHAWISPAFIEGDFDRDGKQDVAILVREKASQKLGVGILSKRGKPTILGAGRSFGNGGDDFSWMDTWELRSAHNFPAIYVGKEDSAGGLIFWRGKKYVWEQYGD